MGVELALVVGGLLLGDVLLLLFGPAPTLAAVDTTGDCGGRSGHDCGTGDTADQASSAGTTEHGELLSSGRIR